MSLIYQMKDIVDELSHRKSSRGTNFMSLYSEDFEVYDVDLIENHYRSGDATIWEIRGDGCGTRMYNAVDPMSLMFFETNALNDSEFYKIEVTGPDAGIIEKVKGRDQARDIIKKLNDPEKVRTRMTLFDSIAKEIGIESVSAMPANFKGDLMFTSGEDMYFKVEYDELSRSARVSMAKPRLEKDEPGVSRTKVNQSSAVMNPNTSVFLSEVKDKFFKATPGRDSLYGKIEPTTKAMYNAAVRKAQKQEAELGYS